MKRKAPSQKDTIFVARIWNCGNFCKFPPQTVSIRFFNRVTRIIKFSKSSKKVPTISSADSHYTLSITGCQVKSFVNPAIFSKKILSVFSLSPYRHVTIILEKRFVKRFILFSPEIFKPPHNLSHARILLYSNALITPSNSLEDFRRPIRRDCPEKFRSRTKIAGPPRQKSPPKAAPAMK